MCMKTITMKVLLAATLFTAVGCADKKDDSAERAEEQNEATLRDSMEDDAEFAVAAADGGMFEVQLGELAQKNGSSPRVKEFGKMMATDHAKVNDELKNMAAQKNITLPTTLSADKQDTYNKLAKKTGREFDRDYADLMVKEHRRDIDKFREIADDGKDAEIKAWATGKVAALEAHLQKAQAMQDAVK
jgi:putative membrane protein